MLQRTNRFLSGIQRQMTGLTGDLVEVGLSVGQVLCEPGEPIRKVYFPHSGAISKLAVFQDGAEIECVMVGREGVVGAIATLGFETALTRDVCHVNARAVCIDARRLYQACQACPDLRGAFQHYCAWKMSCAIRNGACNGLHGIEPRLCRWLLTCSDVLEEPEIRLPQDAFAKMLGAQRTSVNPILQRLRASGLIELARGRVTIRDRARLQQRACECYEVNRTAGAQMWLRGARPPL